MLLQLFTSGIHDLKVAIEIRMFGDLYSIENHPPQTLEEVILLDTISRLKLLANYLEPITDRLLYSILVISKPLLIGE